MEYFLVTLHANEIHHSETSLDAFFFSFASDCLFPHNASCHYYDYISVLIVATSNYLPFGSDFVCFPAVHDVIIMNLWLYICSSACCNFQLFVICYPVAMITNQFLLSISALVIYLTSFLDMHLLVFDLSSMLWDLDGKIVMLVSFPYLYLFMIMYLFTAKKGPFFLRMLLWPFCTHKRWERSQTITEKSLAFYWVLESGKSLLHVT